MEVRSERKENGSVRDTKKTSGERLNMEKVKGVMGGLK